MVALAPSAAPHQPSTMFMTFLTFANHGLQGSAGRVLWGSGYGGEVERLSLGIPCRPCARCHMCACSAHGWSLAPLLYAHYTKAPTPLPPH